ncbi:hypothetical protein [Roseofilum capinflatum]|uniref:Uncharacterized protein n=1 Tax=Roseofilum capinflatum BLCC-M114 TaxID=3022440 RepID=A0ABT7BBV6_9CYAN|nr:hypothetical protein [Roseofilum capinflatum]MDJ1176642.1 hypothetical protein [Roseofilum capinflatum BLCC-M114]
MNVILSALVPVTFIISIGMIAGRTLTLERSTLSELAVYILTPALISSSLYQAQLSTDTTLGLIMGYLITSLGPALLQGGGLRDSLRLIIRLPLCFGQLFRVYMLFRVLIYYEDLIN